MPNRGIAPPDPETLVGEFRLLYGDITYVALDPPEVGYGDYTELSDDEIEMFLAKSGDSVARAIGVYYTRLAGDAAKVSKDIKDHDLAANTAVRAQELRQTAKEWFDVADAEDAEAGLSDIFQIYSTGPAPQYRPEAAPYNVYVF